MSTLKISTMGMSFNWIINLMVSILSTVLPLVTPVLSAELQTTLLQFYEAARKTPNPWDDFLAKMLLRILSIPVPEE